MVVLVIKVGSHDLLGSACESAFSPVTCLIREKQVKK